MLYAIGYVATAWLLADLASGVAHWWEDRYSRPEWPIVGPLISAPNLRHHRKPLAMLDSPAWLRSSTTAPPAAVLGLCLWLLLGSGPWLLACVFLAAANEVHAMQHRPNPGRIVRAAQATGIIQGREAHAAHHRPPHLAGYCVLSCWANPILDGLGAWRAAEWLIARVAGIHPARN